MRRRRRWLWILVAVAAASSAGWLVARRDNGVAQSPTRAVLRAVPSATGLTRCEDDATRQLQAPSDVPAHLLCFQARLVAEQVRVNLVQPPARVDPRAFAMSVADWLDPHGLWSASPDAPFSAAVRDVAPRILSSFERPNQAESCEAAGRLGALLASWVDELRSLYDRGYDAAAREPVDMPGAWSAITEPAFEDGAVTIPARQLAPELGRRMALVARALGPDGPAVAQAFRTRLFPPLSGEGWAEVVLAAALRAFVLHVDPHGAWAPLDEETSLYEVELEASGRTRMWSHLQRTVAGLRLDGTVTSPLQPGDIVLSVGSVITSGLTVEQADQLGVLDPADPDPVRIVRVLRAGAPMDLRVVPPSIVDDAPTPPSVHLEAVPYGDTQAFVLDIPDVPDDLGDQVEAMLAHARELGQAAGLVLDLRGNGGGSIDGAKATLGLFLPGAPLFPMLRRDRSVEIETAPVTDPDQRWGGPVAVIVDGNTASAAEMIAGALQAYQRATVVGSRTFGKGCAQEYVDDQAGVGVLRLTTLLYALPDGSPVQRVGLSPSLRIDPPDATEREASLENAFPTWRGPDVRRRSLMVPVPWPAHSGHVGPCEDATVCQALRLLGASRPPTARSRKP